jgi:hypothetical protein
LRNEVLGGSAEGLTIVYYSTSRPWVMSSVNSSRQQRAQAAAIAKSRALVIVTLNLRNFEPLGVDTLNPFDPD